MQCSNLFSMFQDAVSDVSDYLVTFNADGQKGLDSIRKILKSSREMEVQAIQIGSLLLFRRDLIGALRSVK